MAAEAEFAADTGPADAAVVADDADCAEDVVAVVAAAPAEEEEAAAPAVSCAAPVVVMSDDSDKASQSSRSSVRVLDSNTEDSFRSYTMVRNNWDLEEILCNSWLIKLIDWSWLLVATILGNFSGLRNRTVVWQD